MLYTTKQDGQRGLSLRHTASDKTLNISFLTPKLLWRARNTSLRREALARAAGLKNNTHPRLVDATAGLGQDSFILAALGFEIILIERSPIIHQQLAIALQQAAAQPDTAAIVQRMHLIHADARDYLPTLAPPANIIFLDPMFPARQKSALPKLAMRQFHDIVGDDVDANELLDVALACATDRVVVKRPRLATALSHCSPNFSQKGSSCRFDVYLKI